MKFFGPMKLPLLFFAWFTVCISSVAVLGKSRIPEVAGPSMRERIQDMIHGVRDVPLPVIVEALSGHAVLPWQGEQKEALAQVAGEVLATINKGGVLANRVNEAGNAAEKFVQEALRANGFEAGRPLAPSGRARAAGYPDVEASRGEDAFYMEVKVCSSRTENSTQRTFYLSPSADFKVTRDAHHLLIAIELAPAVKGLYRARSVRWLDLSRLVCDLKYEFNASNRDMYDPDASLIILESANARE
ncbi:MAG: hypothetical protein ACREIA_10330 [Opitutaceae bacterium]